jgi:DNA-nicking Smr family endonuclease
MDFGSILDEWDKRPAKPGPKKTVAATGSVAPVGAAPADADGGASAGDAAGAAARTPAGASPPKASAGSSVGKATGSRTAAVSGPAVGRRIASGPAVDFGSILDDWDKRAAKPGPKKAAAAGSAAAAIGGTAAGGTSAGGGSPVGGKGSAATSGGPSVDGRSGAAPVGSAAAVADGGAAPAGSAAAARSGSAAAARAAANARKVDPLSAWLRIHGVQDKDSQVQDEELSREERRRRLIEKRPDAVVDLHGLTRDEAWDRLGIFFSDARRRGFEKVLIVHGKGNHSQGEAILKRTTREFIERCAYAGSHGHAPPTSGGTGATWVIVKQGEGVYRSR